MSKRLMKLQLWNRGEEGVTGHWKGEYNTSSIKGPFHLEYLEEGDEGAKRMVWVIFSDEVRDVAWRRAIGGLVCYSISNIFSLAILRHWRD